MYRGVHQSPEEANAAEATETSERQTRKEKLRKFQTYAMTERTRAYIQTRIFTPS